MIRIAGVTEHHQSAEKQSILANRLFSKLMLTGGHVFLNALRYCGPLNYVAFSLPNQGIAYTLRLLEV